MFSRGGSLLSSIYADARYIDDVIVLKALNCRWLRLRQVLNIPLRCPPPGSCGGGVAPSKVSSAMFCNRPGARSSARLLA